MLGIFSSKKNHFVGVDFGTSAIKIVELTYKEQRPHLINYGWIDLDAVLQVEDVKEMKLQSYEDKLKECFKELCQQTGVKKEAPSFVALPGFSGLITLIELPEMSNEELESAIQFEAHKYIPATVEEIALSWEVVGKNNHSILKNDEKDTIDKLQVLLVAAPKKEVAKYEGLINSAGLEIGAIELETFSIARALVGDDAGTFLILDMGARSTNIILVEKGIVRISRNMDAGSSEITKAIAEGMNISKSRAEIFKKGEKDLLNSKDSTIVLPVIGMIVDEANRMIGSYKSNNQQAKIDGVILSGGAAHMKGAEQYFAEALGIKSTLGNPWRRIVCDESVLPHVEKLGSAFTVAVGLALRGVEEYQRK